MNERRRPPRRGRGTRPKHDPLAENGEEDNPYRESPAAIDSPELPARDVVAEAPVERGPLDSEDGPVGDGSVNGGELGEDRRAHV